MRRSEINSIIRESLDFLREHRFFLPPFATWTPQDWEKKGEECSEIARCRGLGWDITDFGRRAVFHVWPSHVHHPKRHL